MSETKITVRDFVDQVRMQCDMAAHLGLTPQYLVIHPEVLRVLSIDAEFHTLQEFSQSRIVQESPKLRFLRVHEKLVLTLVEKRGEFMFHLE